MLFRATLIGAAVLVLILSATASAQKVTYDAAPGTDFSAFKTYKWQRAEDARYPDPETDRILINAIDAELAKKGLRKTDSVDADLYVTYQLAIVDNAEWSSITHNIGWPAGQSTLAGFPGATTNSSKPIQVGWMIVDMYDVKLKKQVWQATATKTLGTSTDPQKRESNAKKAMAKVFEKYPPPRT